MYMMRSNTIKGTEALLLSLIKEGTDTIFGYPGGTIMPLYDQLFDFKDQINHILVRHEQGAVHAAEGYARATGKVGVCMATAGPGATNLVTGIADAMMDSTPLVCITAQVNADKLGTNFFQEADTISITIPVTKWSYQITHADEVADIIAKAFYIARSGRPGPVLISFTRNAQIGETKFSYKTYKPLKISISEYQEKNEASVRKAIQMINLSEKPMIIAGQGIILSKAEELLVKLAEKGNIPVVSTLMGLSSVPTKHPLFCGNVGMHGNIAPNKMTQSSDLIIAAGMRFSDRVTGDTSMYAPNAKIIHIDIDKAEFNKNIKSHIQIHADVKETFKSILKGGVEYKDRKEWFSFILSQKELEIKEVTSKYLANNEETISMAQVVDLISSETGGDAVIVTDVGQHQMFSARFSKHNKSRSMITSGGLGTMGYGLPAALGAKVGVPDREVIAIVGDGGFQMSIQELGTIMQSNINIKIVILNNSFLGMVRQWQQLFFDRRYSFTNMCNPDFVKIASAYNIKAKRVTSKEALACSVKEMVSHNGCYLLEVVVKSEENIFPMVPSGASLDNIMY